MYPSHGTLILLLCSHTRVHIHKLLIGYFPPVCIDTPSQTLSASAGMVLFKVQFLFSKSLIMHRRLTSSLDSVNTV